MVIFRLFKLSELREAYRDTLQELECFDNPEWQQFLKSRTLDNTQRMVTSAGLPYEQELSEKHKIILKDSYLHPYEKYTKEENAKRQLNVFLKKLV